MTHTTPPPFTEDCAPQLADIVAQVPGVAYLDGGRFGECSTYLPHQIVQGISLDAHTHRLNVSIAVSWPYNVHNVANALRTALSDQVDAPIDVFISDISTPASPTTQ